MAGKCTMYRRITVCCLYCTSVLQLSLVNNVSVSVTSGEQEHVPEARQRLIILNVLGTRGEGQTNKTDGGG